MSLSPVSRPNVRTLRLCQRSDMHGHNHNEQDRTTAVSYSTQHDLPKHRADLTTTSALYDTALEICDAIVAIRPTGLRLLRNSK